MSDYRLPSSGEVRRVLEALPEEEIQLRRKFAHSMGSCAIDGRAAKFALMYEYLIAGRSCEAAGKYMPQRKHAIETKIMGESAVLFAAKTAKRKTDQGWLLRPILLPLNPEYEPWAQRVLDYMNEFDKEEYPFKLHENPRTSGHYLQNYAIQVFEGEHWYFVDYTRSAFADPSLGFTYDRSQGGKRHVIAWDELPAYGKLVSYERTPGWVPVAVRVPARWRDLGSHELRKDRLRFLKASCNFKGSELNMYAGWDEKSAASASRHYIKDHSLELDIGQDDNLPMTLANMAAEYFPKLLRPIEALLSGESGEVGGIEIIG